MEVIGGISIVRESVMITFYYNMSSKISNHLLSVVLLIFSTGELDTDIVEFVLISLTGDVGTNDCVGKMVSKGGRGFKFWKFTDA